MQRWAYWAVAVVLLFGVWVMAHDLQRESLSFDESWSWWAIHNTARPEVGIRGQLRTVRDDFLLVWDNIRRDDVHPPLYYLGLNAWTLVMGESVFSLRVLSLLWGTLALGATIALGRAMLGWQAGLAAGALLVGAGVFVYHARDARMYTQWFALMFLTVLACWRWMMRPSVWRGLVWGSFSVLAFWTHLITGLFVPVLWGVALVMKGGTRPRYALLLIPVLITLVGAGIWVPFAREQLAQRVGAGDPLPTDWATVSAIVHQLSHEILLLGVAVLAIGAALSQPRTRQPASLLLVFALAPVGVLLLMNTQMAVFQMRYILPIWGAWAVLLALGFVVLVRRAVWLVGVVTLFVAWQMASFVWLPKPAYAETAQAIATLRDSREPALVALLGSHPLRYHARESAMLDGIMLDMSWDAMLPLRRYEITKNVQKSPRVWVVAQVQDPALWDVVGALGRGFGHVSLVHDALVVRLDADLAPADYNFGDALAYTGSAGMVARVAVGEVWCITDSLAIQGEGNANWHMSLQITEGFNSIVAQHDSPLGEEACVTVARAGEFHVRLMVYDVATGARLPVLPLGTDYLGVGVLVVE